MRETILKRKKNGIMTEIKKREKNGIGLYLVFTVTKKFFSLLGPELL